MIEVGTKYGSSQIPADMVFEIVRNQHRKAVPVPQMQAGDLMLFESEGQPISAHTIWELVPVKFIRIL